ncbi:MAG: hypothetical protein ABIG95_00205 [Candidatus Woesearchaeota archaeon]
MNSDEKKKEALPVIDQDFTIQTDVDSLVKIVDEKLEIPLNEVARLLNVKSDTVQAWANFLEEEEVLSLKYKFTTPYLVSKAKESKKPEALDIPQELFLPEHPKVEQAPSKEPSKPREEVLNEWLKAPQKASTLTAISKNITELFESAYKNLEKGDLEKAKQIYLSIKAEQDVFPKELHSIKRNQELNLTKLNKDLTLRIQEAALAKANAINALIDTEIKNISNDLSGKDIRRAENSYKKIEELFSKFPEGFESRKNKIHSKIIIIHRDISEQKSHLLKSFADRQVQEMNGLLADIEEQLQHAPEKSFATYEELRRSYAKLPEGFQEEYAALDNKIFSLLPRVMAAKQELAAKSLQQKLTEIKQLQQQTYDALKTDKLKEAKLLYVKVKELHESIPQQFLQKKLEVENEIVKLFFALESEITKEETLRIDHATKQISKLHLITKQYLDKNQLDLADSVYREILNYYHSIPIGYLELRTKIRLQILDLHKEILLKAEKLLTTDFNEQTLSRYKQLVQLLIEVREHIDQKQYDLMEEKYNTVIQSYGQLPLALVQQKKAVLNEIVKLSTQVDIYSRLKKLSQTNSNADLTGQLSALNHQILLLAKQPNVNSEFLANAKQQYMAYLTKLPTGPQPTYTNLQPTKPASTTLHIPPKTLPTSTLSSPSLPAQTTSENLPKQTAPLQVRSQAGQVHGAHTLNAKPITQTKPIEKPHVMDPEIIKKSLTNRLLIQGELKLQDNQFAEAEQIFSRVLTLDNTNREARANLQMISRFKAKVNPA